MDSYLKQQIKKLFHYFFFSFTGAWISNHSGTNQGYFKRDMAKFVVEFSNDRLFDVIPGRQHSAFQGFVSVRTINDPGKLKRRLKKCSRKLDIYRDILP